MNGTISYKILNKNLLEGTLKPGEEIKIKINQTLTHDSTGAMVYLHLDNIDDVQIKTDISAAYNDHYAVEYNYCHANQHKYIKNSAIKYGLRYFKTGTGICHILHLENFSKPGDILIGADSHTPTCGAVGMLSFASDNFDVAGAMLKGYSFFTVPKVFNIKLEGKLSKLVSAKDIVLRLLNEFGAGYFKNYIIEYSGEGVKNLTVDQRSALANMGAELGAKTTLFPSDDMTKSYLELHGRGSDFSYLSADEDAFYDKTFTLDLCSVKPMVALPHKVDNVVEVTKADKVKVNQIIIGGCTNSSYADLTKVALMLKGKKVKSDIDFVISPGSRTTLNELSKGNYLNLLISAGAKILEPGCGPCIGVVQVPSDDAVSIRTFNKNDKGRCGNARAGVYLASPETAVASALTGFLTDPHYVFEDGDSLIEQNDAKSNFDELDLTAKFEKADFNPEYFDAVDKFPSFSSQGNSFDSIVLFKNNSEIADADITSKKVQKDDYRLNIPHLAKKTFGKIDEAFYERALSNPNGIILGGHNFGHGKSKEQIVLVLVHLKIRTVIAKSFAPNFHKWLIKCGIAPLLISEADFDSLSLNDKVRIDLSQLKENSELEFKNASTGNIIKLKFDGSERDLQIIEKGSFLHYLNSVN